MKDPILLFDDGLPVPEPEPVTPPSKKKYLTDFYDWLANKRLKITSLPNDYFPSKYVLEATITDIDATPICDRLYNNPEVGWKDSMRNASLLAKNLSRNSSCYKPRWNPNYNIYDKSLNAKWKLIKQTYNLSNRDKFFLYSIYGEDTLLNSIDDEVCSKIKMSELNNTDEQANYIGSITTKYELNVLLNKMISTVCAKCPYYRESDKRIFIDMNSENYNDNLKEVKAVFFADDVMPDDVDHMLPFTDFSGMKLREMLNATGMKSSEYLLCNTICCSNFDVGAEADTSRTFHCFDYIETILDCVRSNKELTLFLCASSNTNPAFERFGLQQWNEEYNRYDGILTTPFDLSYDVTYNPQYIMSFFSKDRKKKVPNNRKHQSSEIYKWLKEHQSNIHDHADHIDFSVTTKFETHHLEETPKVVTPSSNGLVIDTQAPPEPTIVDFDQLLDDLGDGWTYINSSARITPKRKKDGEMSMFGKETPFVVLRKGDQKVLKYINPNVDIYYTMSNSYRIAEKMEDLGKICRVPYTSIRASMYQNDRVTCWYNVDFPISVYVTDILRNKHHYNEGNDTLRIWYFDIEAEMATVKVKIDDESIDGRIRLFTVFDTIDKVFYCAVRKEKANKDQVISYNTFVEETKDKKGRDIKSGPYPVIVKEFEDERDIFKYFNYLLAEKDPDIITGWNSETYDIPYMFVRGNTLGVPIHNKYSYFYKGVIHTRDGYKSIISCDGIVFTDYLVMYKIMQQNKKENYKLDTICEDVLGPYRKKNEIENSHDWMYEHKLELYLMYNTVDVYRVYELENSLSYFKYQTEVIRICNVGWDDIYAKTKMIDGLVFNHVLKNGYVLKTKNKNVERGEDSYSGATVLESQPGLYEEAADLDLTSLYPSIMIRYNLLKDCLTGYVTRDLAELWLYNRSSITYPFILNLFEDGGVNPYTVEMESQFAEYLKDKIITMNGTIYWKPQIKRSYVSEILEELLKQRGVYKKKRKEAEKSGDTALYERYDVIQMAYKQLTNSFYGVMGLLSYRLSDFNTAASITASGREITKIGSYYVSKYLEKMIELHTTEIPYETVPISITTIEGLEEASNRKYVIYGDTDSLFINVGAVVRSLLSSDSSVEDRVKAAWDIIGKTAGFINEYVIHNILYRKGIDPNDEYKKYNFNYKQEYVMSKALFLDIKKNYACKIILHDGNLIPSDDPSSIDIKGLAPKKSSYARAGRECSGDVIAYILEKYDLTNRITSNRDIEKIINDYVTKCRDLCKLGDTNIATPVTMSTDLKDYKAVSAHIRGMLIYDAIYDHDFRMFEKGYAYPITTINWDKLGLSHTIFMERFAKKFSKYNWYERLVKGGLDLNTIVLPMDLDQGLDTNIFTINVDKVIEDCVYNRVENIVKVVGITALTPEQKLKEAKQRDIITL